ncbi:hypothetical protein [Kitasatospora sp. NPDC087314]|uniref:hypothetical protein n=1 Tax=Kitasatospora sp. NPDC087314 TaxID=3364068 RepID=UPI00381A72EA
MDPIEIAPGVMVTPKFVADESSVGMLARIRGTHPRYELARDFLRRSGPPWGWIVPGNGLYEWRVRSGDRDGARFFVVKGALRRTAEVVLQETATALASRMGVRGS